MTSPTWLALGASPHLGALPLLHVGLCPLEGWLQGLKRTKARGARSLKDQAPEFTERFMVKSSVQTQGERGKSFHLFTGGVCVCEVASVVSHSLRPHGL